MVVTIAVAAAGWCVLSAVAAAALGPLLRGASVLGSRRDVPRHPPVATLLDDHRRRPADRVSRVVS